MSEGRVTVAEGRWVGWLVEGRVTVAPGRFGDWFGDWFDDGLVTVVLGRLDGWLDEGRAVVELEAGRVAVTVEGRFVVVLDDADVLLSAVTVGFF